MADPLRPSVLPLPSDALEQWQGDLAKARQVRKSLAKWWEANLKVYAPSPSDDPMGYGTTLNTNRDFTLVERKKADLFYQRPDVSAVASPLLEGHEALLEADTTILNEKLGLDGVHAKALVHQLLFDVLCPAGTGWSVMGYESVTIPTETVDPMTGQPMMAPVPIFEDCYWRYLSPWQALVPRGFKSTQWDDAPWLGYDFEVPVRVAKRKGWVPDDYRGGPPSPELAFDTGLGHAPDESVAKGSLIWYKSALYRDDIVHPQHLTLLILMDGIDQPAEHKDSPYQTITPKGNLSPDSLIGFPIHPLTIRTLTDSAQVPSDCTISRPIVNELNKFRGQMIEQREANILRWQYNTDVMPPEAVTKMVKSPIGGMIGVPGDAYVGEGAIKELPHGTYPRENFSFNDYLDNDLARTHGLDANQQGVSAQGDQTATEAQLQQGNANARLGLERGIVLDWYIRGVTKYAAIVRRLLPVEDAAAILGQQKAAEWDSWRHTIPAALAFTAMPNSTLRQDTSSELDRRMKHYTYWANDPYINRAALAQETLKYLGYSPKVFQAQPPPKGPEPAKPGFSFKGDDLNPLNPQFPIVIAILQQSGVTIDPTVIAEAQAGAKNALLMQSVAGAQAGGPTTPGTEHGGKIPALESLDKHQAEQTGAMQGSGQAVPFGAGGMVQ